MNTNKRKLPVRLLCTILAMIMVIGVMPLSVFAVPLSSRASFRFDAGNVATTETVSFSAYRLNNDLEDTCYFTNNFTLRLPDEEPVRSGYSFAGWFNSSDSMLYQAGEVAPLYDDILSTTLFTAQWEDPHQKYVYTSEGWAAGTTGFADGFNTTKKATFDAGITLSANEPTRAGYTFAGWYSPDYGTTYEPGATVVSLDQYAVMEFQALWTQNPGTPTAVYSYQFVTTNDSEVGSWALGFDTVYAQSETSISLPAGPSRPGYVFGGWYSEYYDETYAADATVTLVADRLITLEAVWSNYRYIFKSESSALLTLNYFDYNVEYSMVPAPGETADITLPNAQRSGYTLKGWLNSFDETLYLPDSKPELNKDEITEFRAIWNKEDVYSYEYLTSAEGNVSFDKDLNIAKENSTDTLTLHDTEPDRTDYIFGGWYSEYYDETYAAGDTVALVLGKNITLQAIWQNYSYEFKSEDFANVTIAYTDLNTMYSQTTDTLTLPAGADTTRTGNYELAGWYNSVDGTIYAAGANVTLSLDEHTVFEAVWDATDVYSYEYLTAAENDVTFTEDMNATVKTTDTTVTLPVAEPTRTGYAFGGWYSEYYNEVFDANETVTLVEGKNITLQMLWNSWSYEFRSESSTEVTGITFNTVNNVATDTVDFDGTVPVRDGYAFIGWLSSYDESVYDAGATNVPLAINEKVTFRAVWESDKTQAYEFTSEKEGTVTWTAPADVIGTLVRTSDVTITIPTEEPTRNNYTFEGWYCEYYDTVYQANDVVNLVTGRTITFEAVWESINVYSYQFHTVNKGDVTWTSATEVLNKLVETGDTTLTIPTEVPTRNTPDSYTFDGWYCEYYDETYAAGDEVQLVEGDLVKFEAVWKPFEYAVTSNIDTVVGITGAGILATQNIAKGENFEFALIVGEGYNQSVPEVKANNVPLAAIGHYTLGKMEYYQYSVKITAVTDIVITDLVLNTYVVTLPVSEHFDAIFTDPTSDDKSQEITYNEEYIFSVTSRVAHEVVSVYVNGVLLQGYDDENCTAGHQVTPPYATETPTYFKVENVQDIQSVTVDVKEIEFFTVNFYQVIGEGDGKTITMYSTQSVQRDKFATAPVAPAVKGYTFGGWFTDEACSAGNEFNFATDAIVADTNLYAKFTANTYDITFDDNTTDTVTGMPDPNPITKTYGTAIAIPSGIPVREGYIFKGWALTEDAEIASYMPGDMFSEEILNNITMYAVWDISTHEVVLPAGNGYTTWSNQSTTVEFNNDFEFYVRVADGYSETTPIVTVTYTDPGTSNEVTSNLTATATTLETSDDSVTYTYVIEDVKTDKYVSIYAILDTTYTVTYQLSFDGEDGINLDTAAYMTQEVVYNDLATRPVDPVVEGYIFNTWYAVRTIDGTSGVSAYSDEYDFTTQVKHDITLYAEMVRIEPDIDFTDFIDALLNAAKAGYVCSEDDIVTVPYNTNYDFTVTVYEGWDASAMQVAANGYSITPSSVAYDGATKNLVYSFSLTNVKDDIKVTVTGVKRATVTVTFDDNSGVGGPVSQVVNYYLATNPYGNDNSTLVTTEPTRVGYTFMGWDEDASIDPDVTTPAYQGGDVAEFTTDTVLHAIWDELTPTITFDKNTTDDVTNMPDPNPITKIYDESIAIPDNIPVREGYNFIGWTLTPNAVEPAYYPGDMFSENITENITMYALWEIITHEVVLPDGNGYTVWSEQSTTVEWDDDFEFYVRVADDYSEAAPVVTVTYTDPGTGNEITINLTPTETDNETDDDSITYTYMIENVRTDKYVSIYAIQDETYTVTYLLSFDSEVGVNLDTTSYVTQEVVYNDLATRPVDPVVEGYIFNTWYAVRAIDGTGASVYSDEYDFTTQVTGDITLYAEMVRIEPDIDFTDFTAALLNAAKAGYVCSEDDIVTVVYNGSHTFTVTVYEGWDASAMQVSANEFAVTPDSVNYDAATKNTTYTYTLNYVKVDTKVTVTGVVRDTVTITYDDNGGEGGPAYQIVNYYLENNPYENDNSTITMAQPTRIGYQFIGWDENAALDPDTTTPEYESGDVADFTADVVLHAVWDEITTSIRVVTDKPEYFEGDNIILTATVTSGTAEIITTGTVEFYQNGTLIATVPVTSGKAVWTTQASRYDTNDATNMDIFVVRFIPAAGEGYDPCDSVAGALIYNVADGTITVNPGATPTTTVIKSTAFTWALNRSWSYSYGDTSWHISRYQVQNDADKLTIYDDRSNTTVATMTANKPYTLEIPNVYALASGFADIGTRPDGMNATLGTPLTVGTDYYVTWQYKNDHGDWVDYTDVKDKDTVYVTPEYSKYEFKAVVTPRGGATTSFNCATRYTQTNVLDATSYVGELFTQSSGEVQLAEVAIEIAVSDKIDNTISGVDAIDAYQGDMVEITAKVTADYDPIKPSGTVTFYYSVDGAEHTIGTVTLEENTDHEMVASIETRDLPVTSDTNTNQVVDVYAVYTGNDTFGEEVSEEVAITIYSSVVYVNSDIENRIRNRIALDGIYITVDGTLDPVSNDGKVTLILSDIYTLDRNDVADTISLLENDEHYDVKWQKLNNAVAYLAEDGTPLIAESEIPWEDIASEENTSCSLLIEDGTAYRAVITVRSSVATYGSYEQIQQVISGRRTYYSNILMSVDGDINISTFISTSLTDDEHKGIVEGETVYVNTYVTGSGDVTSINKIHLDVVDQRNEEIVYSEEKFNVNGFSVLTWDTSKIVDEDGNKVDRDINEIPGYYRLECTATDGNGFETEYYQTTVIVRDDNYEIVGEEVQTVTYDGQVKGIDVGINNMNIEPFLAQEMWTASYYRLDEDGVASEVACEPTEAGEYKVVVTLPESEYWTDSTAEFKLVIEKREVGVADLVAAAKVYNGDTDANIVEIILEEAVTDQTTTGLPTNDSGIINGDSVYATGVGYTTTSAAGTTMLGVNDLVLEGPDAANYVYVDNDYEESFVIARNQLNGKVNDGVVYGFTANAITLSADDYYLINQQGTQITEPQIVYYYHNGEGVEKVDNMLNKGKYTVIVTMDQANYKGGITMTAYVGNADAEGTWTADVASVTIEFANTVKVYDELTTGGITATASQEGVEVTLAYYYDAAWQEIAPADAGRYIVRATAGDDVAYGIYTIVKAHPVLTMDIADKVYDSSIDASIPTLTYNGTQVVTGVSHISVVGDTLHGLPIYQTPADVGNYIVTVHFHEMDNYTAYEVSDAYSITPKTLVVTADSLQRNQYGSYPAMTATFEGLAEEGVAPDNSLRDVQIQPEILFNPTDGISNYDNDSLDQVGQIVLQPVSALAKNYSIRYVNGYYSTTEKSAKINFIIYGEPSGKIVDANDDFAAYYGDSVQLYAYGNTDVVTGIQNTSSIYEWSVVKEDGFVGDITISDRGYLTINGVGPFTVVLKRGYGVQQITANLYGYAMQKELAVVVPNQDLVFNGEMREYDRSEIYAVDSMLEVTELEQPVMMRDNYRQIVGSQSVYAKIADEERFYCSEEYSGLFTINDKEVTVTPVHDETDYGTKSPDGLEGHTENGTVDGFLAITEPYAVSITNAYANLDTADNGYEILVAGIEDINYNVRYNTNSTTERVTVNKIPLTVSTGSYNNVGRTEIATDGTVYYPASGEVFDSSKTLEAKANRMYGEPNRVMGFAYTGMITGDSSADLMAYSPWLVTYEQAIAENPDYLSANANVTYPTRNEADPEYIESRSEQDYIIHSDDTMISFRNYDPLSFIEGTQDIYQRPVELSLKGNKTRLSVYYGLYDSELEDEEQIDLLNMILAEVVAGKYNDEGGLAEILNHDLDDLHLYISEIITPNPDKPLEKVIRIKSHNENYYIANIDTDENDQTFEVDVLFYKNTFVVDYNNTISTASGDYFKVSGYDTGAQVTLFTVDETKTVYKRSFLPNNDKLICVIFVDRPDGNYYNATPILVKEMTAQSRTGVYTVSYNNNIFRPRTTYRMFAVASSELYVLENDGNINMEAILSYLK